MAPVRGVLLIAVPAGARGEEHLRLIARLSRRLMHEDFREELLTAPDPQKPSWPPCAAAWPPADLHFSCALPIITRG